MRWYFVVLLVFLVSCSKPIAQPELAKSDGLDVARAVQLGEPVKCVSEQSGQTTTIYMKGSKMRMDTSPVDAHGIYTEDLMYTWQGKQGSVMKISEIKQMSAEAAEYKPKSQQEIIDNAQKVNAKCEPADVSESLFVAPADVEFQDLTEMLKQLEAMTESLQK